METKMPTQTEPPTITYPSSDGKPMADSTLQYKWITTIKDGVEATFKDDPTVFVAGDLLWYPVQGNNSLCQAPDVMVVFGRPKGERDSYQQWKEEDIPPQVVFEILSESNTKKEMNRKFLFYHEYGVEEYYVYNPRKQNLEGWIRTDGILDVIESMSGWVSPRLGVRFEMKAEGLELYRPDGQKFVDFVEVDRQREIAEQKAEKFAAKLRELGIDPESL